MLRTFRPSPRFFDTYVYDIYLIDTFYEIYLINIFDIDLRNSKNPTYTHMHTPPTKPLYPPVSSSSASSTRVWVWSLSELINQNNNINPPIYPPFVSFCGKAQYCWWQGVVTS